MKALRWSGVVGALFLYSFAWAAPIPAELRSFLLSRGHQQLVAQYEAIPTMTPEDFGRLFIASQMRLAGAGWNGAAFKDSSGHLMKFSHTVFGWPGVREHWQTFNDAATIKALKLPVHGMIDFAEVASRRPTEKEILGNLLWASYFPQAAIYFPDLVSTDGAAYRRRFVPGTPLNELLAAEKPVFDMKKIWQQIVAIQDVGQRMLADSGVMVDLLSAANFIVSGTLEAPVVELIDHEFVGPTPEARQHYAARGVTIPMSELHGLFEIVAWPLMPDHIVASNNWKLSFDQALDYLTIRYNLGNRSEAIAKLAGIPEWENVIYPRAANYVHIRAARALVSSKCERLLSSPADSQETGSWNKGVRR